MDYFDQLRLVPSTSPRSLRQEAYAYTTDYTSLFAQDTLRMGRLTANIGLRFDRQQGTPGFRLGARSAGFETLPDGTPLLPAVSFDGRDQEFKWEDVAPRLGLTYALGEDRRTSPAGELLPLRRASSTSGTPTWNGPSAMSYAYFYLRGQLSGDGRVTVDEIIVVFPRTDYALHQRLRSAGPDGVSTIIDPGLRIDAHR